MVRSGGDSFGRVSRMEVKHGVMLGVEAVAGSYIEEAEV